MSQNVLIVGAGVIGTCVAHSLAERGCRVTIVDRDGPDARGCSFGNAGMVVPSHFIPLAAPGMVGMALRMMLSSRSPFYIRPRLSLELFGWSWKFWRAANAQHVARAAPILRDLHLASRAGYEELAGSVQDDFCFTRNGLLMLCKTQHCLNEETAVAERARQLGIAADVLDPAALERLEPAVKVTVAGGVLYPKDSHLDPGRLMAALRRKLQAVGARFHWNSQITGWSTDRGVVKAALLADGRELIADQYILCGGSWSDSIARDLRLRLPMQPGKGYSLTLPAPAHQLKTCAILAEARVAVTPMGSTLRFGGTMEIAGFDSRINPARVEGIVRSIPAYFPQFTPDAFAGITPWYGFRPCSPDGLPYLGRPKNYANLIVATGHAMMGVSLAPITGKLVAQIVAGENPEIDIRLLDPDRYN